MNRLQKRIKESYAKMFGQTIVTESPDRACSDDQREVFNPLRRASPSSFRRLPTPTTRPNTPSTPIVRILIPPPVPQAPSRPSCEPDELLVGLDLSAGAARIFRVLHGLSCGVAGTRGFRMLPDTMTFHVPALVVAGLAGYTPRHLRRLVPELEAAGLVASGAHASKVGLRSLWDGTVWTVKVKAGDARPEVRPEDWRHDWRPEFAADVYGKTGARSFMSSLVLRDLDEIEKIRVAALASAVGVYAEQPPAESSSEDMGVGHVQDVVYRLGELPHVHARKRAALVGELASALAHAVDGTTTWRRWWCGVLWRAWNGYVEGRIGELQALGAALLRLDGDRRDGAPFRSYGAVFGGRMRAA